MTRRSFRTAIASAAILATLSLLVVSCSKDSAESKSEPAKGTVGLLTYDGYVLPQDAATAFEKSSGFAIKLTTNDDAGSALSQVLLTAGQPAADVFFGVDNTFLSKATDSDAFVKYEPKASSSIPAEYRLDPSGRFTPVDAAAVCVDFDKQWLAQHQLPVPTDLASLTDARYKNLLVVEDPALSSPGLAFLAATHATFGDRTDEYWRKLKANGVLAASSWSDAWGSCYTVSGGDRPLVVSYVSSPPAEVVDSKGKLAEPKTGVIDSTCFNQVEFVAILEGAPHLAVAKALVDEMVSKRWQDGLPLSNYVLPVVPGAELPPEFQKWAVVPEHPISVSPKEIGDNRDAWIDSWRSIMQ